MSRLSDAEELSLPRLSLGEMERWNRLHVPRAPLAIGNWSIRLGAKVTPIESKQLRVSLPWGSAMLCCPTALLDAIADSLQPGLQASDVAPDLLALLLELAFEPDILAWKVGSNFAIAVLDDLATAEPGQPDTPLTVEAFGQSWPVLIRGRQDVLEAIFQHWPSITSQLAGLYLPAALRLGTTRLTKAMVDSLRPGDVALFERTHAVPPQGVAVLSDRWAAPLIFGANGWRMGAPFAPLSAEEKTWMSADDRPVAVANLTDPENIPVKLGFDLGELEIAIGDLRRLAAGSILQMARPGEAPVRVTANGRPVGSGELVRVEGRIGVKLLRIFEHE